MSDQLAIQGQPTNFNTFAAVGMETRTEAQIQVNGHYLGQPVQSSPASNASQDLADALEAGAAVLMRAALGRLQTGRPGNMQRVNARTATSESSDNGSPSADEEPNIAVKRVLAFLELTREMGGGGGGTGGETGQQRQETVARIRASSEAEAAELMKALQNIQRTIRTDTLSDTRLLEEVIRDAQVAIHDALGKFSADPVRQLLVLEAIRTIAGSYSGAFGEALNRVQQEFTTGISGRQMQEAIRDAYVMVRLQEANQLWYSPHPADKREAMSHQLRNVDTAAKAENLKRLLKRLESDPGTEPDAGALRDVFASQMQTTGDELRITEGLTVDSNHLGSVLTEIGMLKQLNSLFDASEELIRNSKLPESGDFNVVKVMSFILGFMAEPAPDTGAGIDTLNDFAHASFADAASPARTSIAAAA
ncbi:hypothetical protein ACUSIJ_02725 [Pseudochelatococcus sp. B33]